MIDWGYGFGYLFLFIWPLAIFGGIIWLIVYLVRKSSQKQAPGQKKGLDVLKELAITLAISLLSAFFIGFVAAAFFDVLANLEAFIVMLMLSVIFIVAGVAISKRPVISYGLILGGVFALVYNLSLNANLMNAAMKVVFVGIALALLIGIAYKKLRD